MGEGRGSLLPFTKGVAIMRVGFAVCLLFLDGSWVIEMIDK